MYRASQLDHRGEPALLTAAASIGGGGLRGQAAGTLPGFSAGSLPWPSGMERPGAIGPAGGAGPTGFGGFGPTGLVGGNRAGLAAGGHHDFAASGHEKVTAFGHDDFAAGRHIDFAAGGHDFAAGRPVDFPADGPSGGTGRGLAGIGGMAWIAPGAAAGAFATPRDIALPPLVRSHPVALRRPGPTVAAPIPIRRGFTGPEAALKRIFDIVLAALLLAFALPLLVAVALALWLDSPGPVLFIQPRVGRDGRMFGCIKLRTMRVDAEAQLAALLAACPRSRREWETDRKLRCDPRVSPLGRLVRRLSLDELPQLVNVLAGEMSMVGPRPIVPAEIPRYGAFLADYCAVKPGLTGLWQVSGRNDVSYGERVQFDRHYSRHASFLLDLRIAWRTVPAVFLANGSY